MSKKSDENSAAPDSAAVLGELLKTCVNNSTRLDGNENKAYESSIKADQFGYHRGHRLIRILLLLDEMSHATDEDVDRYKINQAIWHLAEVFNDLSTEEYPVVFEDGPDEDKP